MISSQTIARGLFSVLRSGVPHEQVVKGFSSYIHRYHLEATVPQIISYLDFFASQKARDEGLSLVVAHPVSDEVVLEIKSFIDAADSTPVSLTLDESLIGGFIARYRHTEHDASLSTQLSRLEQSIIHNHS
ncbi:F0F1 ATP synthase subunit delta [Patescibacteria group bacterium]|nr:F0F1 ATP synthase subunit delta [Patescibacteria group bacterium]